MRSFWLWIWRRIDGKKLAATLSAMAGYGIAQLVVMFPLGFPTGLNPPLPAYIPWEPLLTLLSLLGVSVGAGHKIVKARRNREKQQNEKDEK
ncbi:MAG: hypothetical protein IPK72_21095 [Candidatus Eisenbacteria bacterium]|nr:hypothetical protein [Candidatus Eisenbacteria bacterium]